MAQAVLVAESKAVELKEDNLIGSTITINVKTTDRKKNRIQVSNTKKPLFFYLNLAKRYIKEHNDVELSALGMAIPTIVTIAEILKANGLAVEKKVLTSTVDSKDENKGRLVQKAKLEIVLEKNDNSKSPAETESESNPAESELEVDADKEG
ncbi:hypothetical protein Nepgr_021809 [Nepenthes gracilis]|uniref:DNA/RNA-binding protein Alba-like domain-containing protein n=1 Tax=Nepenthes gracilis TaxID=150966 RepID=A0AAD3SXG0_NEPGR|nr:hypothetical protein Nepgr_021809 [Nepenthes gracilis]